MAALLVVASAPSARASLGYEADQSMPVIHLPAEVPHGIAIDQSNQRIYATLASSNLFGGASGSIVQLEPNGTPTAASPFTGPSQAFFSGVAVNPITHGIYAAEFIITGPLGNSGSSRIDLYSSAGVAGASFAAANSPATIPQIATDSNGNVFFPSASTKSVLVFNSSGALQAEIECDGCPGGQFSRPVTVALDSANNLYVVDMGVDRVVKFTHSGLNYTYSSTLQEGKGAAAVGVDPSTNDVLVGDLSGGYHIIAYNSAGVQFDDFGSELIAPPPFNPDTAAQIAVNGTTHEVYVTEPSSNAILLFSRVTIGPPSATSQAASPVGQVAAKLNASVNPNLHALVDCDFEYTDAADFAVNAYSNASTIPCTSLPRGSKATTVSATPGSLAPNTTYHYRVSAENNGGPVKGGDLTFTTLPVTAATVTTESPTGVTETAATLKGTVNPHGGSVSDCHFEYGKTDTYGTTTKCATPVELTTSDVAQAKQLKAFSPGTTYHYRLVVTSNAGTVNGDDIEFTTAAPPPPSGGGGSQSTPAPQPTVTPPVTTTPPPAKPKRLKCKKGFRKKTVHHKTRCVRKKPKRK